VRNSGLKRLQGRGGCALLVSDDDRQNRSMTAAVVLIGCPGAGKSSVLLELSKVLDRERVPHTTIESEMFDLGWPELPRAQWLGQLRSAVNEQRSESRGLLLIAVTAEASEELEEAIRAIGADHTLVVCLTVPPAVAAQRVADREPDSWPWKQTLVERAQEFAQTIPSFANIDVLISTDGRCAEHVAAEVREILRT
jgi:thymidylate kinase